MNSMLTMFHSLAETGGTFWLPPGHSTFAPSVDWLFYFIYWINVFFFVLIAVLLGIFCVKYRYRPGYTPPPADKHNTALELTWTFIPTVIVVIIFYYGFTGFMAMKVLPPNLDQDATQVTAHMWSYVFTYNPSGGSDNTLHIPAGKMVEVAMTSDDVIHGFYIPDFRTKQDIVPGRITRIWFQSDDPTPKSGEGSEGYDIFCTQYCGISHSEMRSHVIVDTQADYAEYIKNVNGGNLPPVQRGRLLFTTMGCSQCHTTDDTKGKCPQWKDLYMSKVTFLDGTTVTANADYLHTVIKNPNIHPLPGFQPMMPPTTMLDEKDISDIMAYIESISKYAPHPAATQPTTQPAMKPADQSQTPTAPTTAPSGS